jgi:hypothetical protein
MPVVWFLGVMDSVCSSPSVCEVAHPSGRGLVSRSAQWAASALLVGCCCSQDQTIIGMRRQSGTIIRDWRFEVRLEQKLDSATNRECCHSPDSGCRFRWRVLGSQRHCVFQQFGPLEFEANEGGRRISGRRCRRLFTKARFSRVAALAVDEELSVYQQRRYSQGSKEVWQSRDFTMIVGGEAALQTKCEGTRFSVGNKTVQDSGLCYLAYMRYIERQTSSGSARMYITTYGQHMAIEPRNFVSSRMRCASQGVLSINCKCSIPSTWKCVAFSNRNLFKLDTRLPLDPQIPWHSSNMLTPRFL